MSAVWKGLNRDEAYLAWAALCAVVTGNHSPIYNLTPKQIDFDSQLLLEELPTSKGHCWRGFDVAETEVMSWVLSVEYGGVDGPFFTPEQEETALKLYREASVALGFGGDETP